MKTINKNWNEQALDVVRDFSEENTPLQVTINEIAARCARLQIEVQELRKQIKSFQAEKTYIAAEVAPIVGISTHQVREYADLFGINYRMSADKRNRLYTGANIKKLEDELKRLRQARA